MALAAGAQSSTPERPSSAEIERDMDETRADLAVTLAALRQRLAPPRLVERGCDLVDAMLKKMTGALGAAARRHAGWIGLAGLAGAGLGWFLVAQGRRRSLVAARHDVESLLRPEREPPGWLVGPVTIAGEPPSATAVVSAEPTAAEPEPTRVAGPEPLASSASHRAADRSLLIGALALAAAAAIAMRLPARRERRPLDATHRARDHERRRRGPQDAAHGRSQFAPPSV